MKKKNIIVIGAGPKGLAIAAKNKILQELGIKTPKVILIEKNEIAAHWTGKSGYTNGKMTLGTSPEKDIGFPYDTQDFSPEINEKVNQKMLHFSWMSYLVNTDQYSDYVDRGRQFPKHSEYANYLRWVADQLKESTEFRFGRVKALDLIDGNRVEVTYTSELGDQKLITNGIVFTGPGKSKIDYNNSGSTRVMDIEKFWMNFLKTPFKNGDRIGIVGAGENAASMAIALGDLGVNLKIDIITPAGAIFSRGESFFENQVYTDPKKGNWDKLTDLDKQNFIKRTDLGVFGLYAQTQLNGRRDIEVIPGRVSDIKEEDEGVVISSDYNNLSESLSYEYLVLASGFDQLKMLRDISTNDLLRHIRKKLGSSQLSLKKLESLIGNDMSVEGLGFKLHLPMISRMRQGPGFANLSSLGKLSDRILSGYVGTKESTDITDTKLSYKKIIKESIHVN